MAAHRSSVIVSLAVAVVAALGVAMSDHRVSAQAPAIIPTKDDGYDVTQDSTGESASEGFEGRKERSTVTAVGNTPATMGKRVVAKLVFDNLIRTCPTAEGEAEGEGQFSVTVDSTSAQANETSTLHIDMRAKAKYKGKVNEDAYLAGPVKAEIDYTYASSGTMRGAGGALTTPAGTNITQHVTVPFVVGPGGSLAPSIGALSGGDPSHGQLGEAYSVGTALAYWAGVYYSVAQTKWRTGRCVELWFTPPQKSVQPVPGSMLTVKALVKTKRGEPVPAKFSDARGQLGGSVSPVQGMSTEDKPSFPFTFTAPSQRPKDGGLGGFHVMATSHAGITEKEWSTNLGTNWSGQISCTREDKGEPYSDEQVSGSGYEVTRIEIEVNDGVVFATGYAEKNSSSVTKRPVAGRGYELEFSDSQSGIVSGSRQGAIEVSVGPNGGSYRINPVFKPFDRGTLHSQSCDRNGCKDKDIPYGIQSCLTGLSGTTDSPNSLHGSMGDSKTTTTGNHSSTQSYSVTWDLGRTGTTK